MRNFLDNLIIIFWLCMPLVVIVKYVNWVLGVFYIIALLMMFSENKTKEY